jgi:Tol biopolymer transport system component
VFDSGRNGKIDLYTRPANGASQEELLYHDDLDKYPTSWSADGKYIAYEALGNGHYDEWVMPLFGDRKPYVFLKEKYNTRAGVFFPDGKWMAYTSLESGHRQVYVVAFPKPGGRFRLVYGDASVWSRKGKEILYLDDHRAHGVGRSHGARRQPGIGQAASSVSHSARGAWDFRGHG